MTKDHEVRLADNAHKTSTNNAEGAFTSALIGHIASYDTAVAGLVHAFNLSESFAWKIYAEAESAAIKTWSEQIADFTETWVNARIDAAVTFSRADADATKVAADAIAAAQKTWDEAMADADKTFADTMAVAETTKANALAAAARTKAETDSATTLAYVNTMAPHSVTLATALNAASVTFTTDVATAAVDLAKANADAMVTVVSALATPQITLATDTATAYKTYHISMAEDAADASVDAATAEKNRISALDASDWEFDSYGTYSSYYGGGGEQYWIDDFGWGLLQGGANILNALQDSVIGMINLTQIPGNLVWGEQGLGYIESPDWSRGMFVQESDSVHGWSKFFGGTGAEMLLTAGLSRAATAVDDAGRCANWFARWWNGGCFVAGTQVTLSGMPQGEQLQSALWASDSFLDDVTNHNENCVALLEAPVKTSTTFKVQIEDVPLGARVPTKNPKPWEYDDSLPEPIESEWSKIGFTVRRQDGQIVDAELIRPKSWIEKNGLQAGKLLPLHIPELQISGCATVTSIESCPPISTGEGSVITGRFVTREVHTIARVEILGPGGNVERLEGTTIHPIWSVDRQDWVPLGELYESESLQGETGIVTVFSTTIADVAQPVYNIEVHGEHVYQVGFIGLLVHNAYPGDLGAAVARGMRTITGPTLADDMVDIAARLGNPRSREQIREIIHLAKDKMGIGAAEDLVVDLSGGMWDSRTGEYIGKIWEAI